MISIIAGFIDTATFVHSNLFSCHITGNLVISALEISTHKTNFFRLLTFPSVLIGVYLSSYICNKVKNDRDKLLLPILSMFIQGIIFIVIGILSWTFDSKIFDMYLVSLIVMAMTLQNIMSIIHIKPMTTVMTVNLKKLIISLCFKKEEHNKFKNNNGLLLEHLFIFLSFVLGVIISVLITPLIGFKSCIICGVILIFVGVFELKINKLIST